jgi:hypothetical protein
VISETKKQRIFIETNLLYHMKVNRIIPVLGAVVSIVVVAFGIVFYLIHFTGTLDRDSKTWSDFATFQGYFVNLASLILLGVIGYMTFQTTVSFNAQQLRPLLILTNEPSQFIKQSMPNVGTQLVPSSWYLLNGANVPSGNIFIRFSLSPTGKFTQWVAAYPVSSNGKQEIPWIHLSHSIEVLYSDISASRFFLMSLTNLRSVTTEVKPYDEAKIRLSNFFADGLNAVTVSDAFARFLQETLAMDYRYNRFVESNWILSQD